MLAQLAAEQVMSEDGRSGRARWVVGTAPGRAIPFGAFRHLISLPASGADIGRPAALLRAARSSLTGDAGDLLLVVDDAHNLDPLSATLVYQLARAGAARLVVTVASEAEPPDAIAALWSDDLLTRVAIEPLDRAQTAAFVESALDATLDVADADELFRRSLGNPLYLRHLIDGGGLEHVDGRWRCRDEDRRPLSGVIDEYLCALPEPARAVVDYLAIAEPLARTDLVALVGGEQWTRSAKPKPPARCGWSRQRYQRDFCRPSAVRRPRTRRIDGRARACIARVAGRAAGQAPIRPCQRSVTAVLTGHRRPRQCYPGRGHGCGDRSRAGPAARRRPACRTVGAGSAG
ncbi:conserved hypothetical protein [Mycobacterium tuberculosis T85]|nr:conserved hypothetical protein [Mycobacterium tuberculosis T85]